jgi:S-adenosylhomocysteine hydrolase
MRITGEDYEWVKISPAAWKGEQAICYSRVTVMEWRGITDMPYMIDGHNLIGKLPDISLDDPNDEALLVQKLAG